FPGQRPYVVLSCAMSVDGYLDDATDRRLILSNEADLDRVDGVRADSDAILVGANTIRRDNPRLLVRSPARRAQRVARGQAPASPMSCTWSSRRSSSGTRGRRGSCPTAGSRGTPRTGWRWPRYAGSVTSSCCGTRWATGPVPGERRPVAGPRVAARRHRALPV